MLLLGWEKAKKIPYFSHSFALSEYERRTLGVIETLLFV